MLNIFSYTCWSFVMNLEDIMLSEISRYKNFPSWPMGKTPQGSLPDSLRCQDQRGEGHCRTRHRRCCSPQPTCGCWACAWTVYGSVGSLIPKLATSIERQSYSHTVHVHKFSNLQYNLSVIVHFKPL